MSLFWELNEVMSYDSQIVVNDGDKFKCLTQNYVNFHRKNSSEFTRKVNKVEVLLLCHSEAGAAAGHIHQSHVTVSLPLHL